MKLLVIAATGNLGKAIVNAALRDGHDVSVLVRDGTKVPWNGEQLMVCPGTMVHKAEGAHSFHRTHPTVQKSKFHAVDAASTG